MTARQSDDGDVDDVDGRPLRHSRRFSNERLEGARRVFQKRTNRQLSLEDARQMLENLTGYFATLMEFEQRRIRGENLEDSGRSGHLKQRD